MAKATPVYSDAVREIEAVAVKLNSAGEINAAMDVLHARWKTLSARAVNAIPVGTVVDVTLKGGTKARGIVMKRNTKSLRVDAVEGFGSWNAPAGVLEVVTDPAEIAAAKALAAKREARLGRGF